MALAWNASWEQSLRGSNPLSSANENPLVPVTRGFSHVRGLFRAIGDTAGDMAGSLWGRGWGHGLHLAGYGWRLVGIRLGSGLEAARDTGCPRGRRRKAGWGSSRVGRNLKLGINNSGSVLIPS